MRKRLVKLLLGTILAMMPAVSYADIRVEDIEVENDEAVMMEVEEEAEEGYPVDAMIEEYLYGEEGDQEPIMDEFSGYASFEELISKLPEGYSYTRIKTAEGTEEEKEYLILTDSVYEYGEEKTPVSTTAMVYSMKEDETYWMGSCFGYSEEYPIRIRDHVLYCGSEEGMEAFAITEEREDLVYLYAVWGNVGEDGSIFYDGFKRMESTSDDVELLEDVSDEEYQELVKAYEEAELLNFYS